MLFTTKGTETHDEISEEAMGLISEAALYDGLSDDEISAFLENQSEVDLAMADDIVMEKTIVRLDKKAKLSRAHKMAIFTIAKEKKDPKFKKLVFVLKMRRKLEGDLEKKYGAAALSRAKKVVAQQQKSKSSVVKKAADKAKAMFNAPAKEK